MDVGQLVAEQEKLERKIKHARRFGIDDWPVGTVIVAEFAVEDTSRTVMFVKREDVWARPGAVSLKWEQIVQSLFDKELLRLDVATGWENFDQIRKDQRFDADRAERLSKESTA